MSDLEMESGMSYLASMDEDERVIFLKAMVRLAKEDGRIDDGEKGFITQLAKVLGVPASRAEEVKSVASDDAVVAEAKKIKSRRVAMELIKEMCMLANSDGDLSDRETLLIGRVGQAMGLELEKVEQIGQWVIDRIVWLEEGKIIFERV